MSRPLSRAVSRTPVLGLRSTSRDGRRTGRSSSAIGFGRRDSSIDAGARRRSFSADRHDLDMRVRKGAVPKATQIRRWDGNSRTESSWDSIRRDPELWFPSGDCLVHFYAAGHSRRGPSLRVSLEDIEASNCAPLLRKALSSAEPPSPTASSSSDDGGFYANPRPEGKSELHIAAPPDLNREDAFKYHLTTRNFFAWMFERPIVGAKLGEALIDLQQRMDEFRPDAEQNQDDVLAYIDAQGYSDFRDCPDHALAVLQYAEKFQFSELWTDAFVHCVGMYDRLVSSLEFIGVSRTTKALITRASLEMGLRVERASGSLANFMEDDLTGSYLGLSEPTLRHLERFRSFLQSFYVQKHGYWPPHCAQRRQGNSSPIPKHTLLTMYTDFRNLYRYIADSDSTAGMRSVPYTSAHSIDILEKINSFDRRQKFASLPHSLPLLPSLAALQPLQGKQLGMLSWLIPRRKTSLESRSSTLTELQMATNIDDSKVMLSSIVLEYTRFERDYTMREDDKLPAADARRARWLLIYALLQTLVDVTRAPAEVRDTEGVDYALCCQTAGTPPWTSKWGEANKHSFRAQQWSPAAASNDASTLPPHVAPLDLARVANNRLSSIGTLPASTSTPPPPAIRAPSLARRLAGAATPVVSPQPRKPFAERLIERYTKFGSSLAVGAGGFDSREYQLDTNASHKTNAASPPGSEEVPALSPTNTSRRQGSSDSESGSATSATEAATPIGGHFGDLAIAVPAAADGGVPAPPSPSVYDAEGADETASVVAEMRFAAAGAKDTAGADTRPRPSSSELASRWRNEIRWRPRNGWDDGLLR